VITLIKQLGESLPYAFEFALNLHPNEALASAGTVTVVRLDGQDSDLIVGPPAVSGSQVLVNVSGGSDGVTYQLSVPVVTTLGTRVGQGRLVVKARLP
jgi:hypothetical protein